MLKLHRKDNQICRCGSFQVLMPGDIQVREFIEQGFRGSFTLLKGSLSDHYFVSSSRPLARKSTTQISCSTQDCYGFHRL